VESDNGKQLRVMAKGNTKRGMCRIGATIEQGYWCRLNNQRGGIWDRGNSVNIEIGQGLQLKGD
jgi:hypothetical protein